LQEGFSDIAFLVVEEVNLKANYSRLSKVFFPFCCCWRMRFERELQRFWELVNNAFAVNEGDLRGNHSSYGFGLMVKFVVEEGDLKGSYS
jgi:hypothetical protein